MQPDWACSDRASCPGTPDDHPCTPDCVSRSCVSESGAPTSGFVRSRDAHEAAYCGSYRRAFPSDNHALQDKYEAVLRSAEGAFGMSILARTHKTVALIQVCHLWAFSALLILQGDRLGCFAGTSVRQGVLPGVLCHCQPMHAMILPSYAFSPPSPKHASFVALAAASKQTSVFPACALGLVYCPAGPSVYKSTGLPWT